MRMTNQRQLILDELQKTKEHLTADELFQRVRKKMSAISLATVYRNLEQLSKAEIIKKLEIAGRKKCFDSEISAHDHIVCVECNRVDNVFINKKEAFEAGLAASNGYIIKECRLEFTGLCEKCRKTKLQ